MTPILDLWDSEPIIIRNRELRKNKYKDQREQNMARARTNEKRQKPMGSNGVCCTGTVKGSGEKQYQQTGKKYAGPNYPQASVTGPLQNGGRGGRGAK